MMIILSISDADFGVINICTVTSKPIILLFAYIPNIVTKF